jgi:hypothetical protein
MAVILAEIPAQIKPLNGAVFRAVADGMFASDLS